MKVLSIVLLTPGLQVCLMVSHYVNVFKKKKRILSKLVMTNLTFLTPRMRAELSS